MSKNYFAWLVLGTLFTAGLAGIVVSVYKEDRQERIKLENIQKNWEYIDSLVSRMRVPGGWVIRNRQRDQELIFISDPGHEWRLNEE